MLHQPLGPPSGPATLSLRTPPFAHYGLAWSPFHPTLVALASSANYGLIGNGRLHIARIGAPTPSPSTAGVVSMGIQLDKAYNTQDGIYDVAWSEVHENQIVTASGDGSLKLWDIMLNDLPIRAWQEHTREVFSVDWSNINKEVFASSSWDGLVKIWTPDRPTSMQTIGAHDACVYQVVFSPHSPNIISTCSTDGTLRIFDLRTTTSVHQKLPTGTLAPGQIAQQHPPSKAMLVVPSHATEVLTLDWNKYRPWVIATGSVDRSIKVWDCRNVQQQDTNGGVGAPCELTLPGHEYAVRKVQWSPHRADILASASYDMTCRIWCMTPGAIQQPPLRAIHDTHTEFVAGCAWSLYDEGTLASCSWDHSIHVFRPNIGV